MNLGWVRPLLMTGQQAAVQHAPTILMGLGTVGMGSAILMSAQAGAKTPELLDKAEKEKAQVAQEKLDLEARAQGLAKAGYTAWYEPLTMWEKVQACWKIYIPPAGLFLFSLGCFWGAHGMNLKRQLVLAGLYSTAKASLTDYQAKVAELMGQKTHDEVERSISEDKVAKNLPPAIQPPVIVGGVETWCMVDDQYFRGSWLKIKEAENRFNHNMLSSMYGSKTELYWMLDPNGEYLKPTDEDGQMGWSIDKLLVLDVDSVFTPNHEQVLRIKYKDKDGMPYLPEPGFSSGL